MKKCIEVITILFLLAMLVCLPVFADSETPGLTTVELSEERKTQLIERLDFSAITELENKYYIHYYDVDENGRIALGFQSGGTTNYICVYDSDFNFQYGCEFNSYGSFYLEWVDGCLHVHIERSSAVVYLSEDMAVKDVRGVENTYENGIYEDNLRSRERQIGNETYRVEGGFAQGRYSRLVKYRGDESTVLYDADSSGIKLWAIVIVIVAGVVLFPIFFVKHLRRRIQENRNKQSQ